MPLSVSEDEVGFGLHDATDPGGYGGGSRDIAIEPLGEPGQVAVAGDVLERHTRGGDSGENLIVDNEVVDGGGEPGAGPVAVPEVGQVHVDAGPRDDGKVRVVAQSCTEPRTGRGAESDIGCGEVEKDVVAEHERSDALGAQRGRHLLQNTVVQERVELVAEAVGHHRVVRAQPTGCQHRLDERGQRPHTGPAPLAVGDPSPPVPLEQLQLVARRGQRLHGLPELQQLGGEPHVEGVTDQVDQVDRRSGKQAVDLCGRAGERADLVGRQVTEQEVPDLGQIGSLRRAARRDRPSAECLLPPDAALQIEPPHAGDDPPPGVPEFADKLAQPRRGLTPGSVEAVKDQRRPPRAGPLPEDVDQIVVQSERHPHRSGVTGKSIDGENDDVLATQPAGDVVEHPGLAAARRSDENDAAFHPQEVVGCGALTAHRSISDPKAGVVGEGAEHIVCDAPQGADVRCISAGRSDRGARDVEVGCDVGSASPRPFDGQTAPQLDEMGPRVDGVRLVEQRWLQTGQGCGVFTTALIKVGDVDDEHPEHGAEIGVARCCAGDRHPGPVEVCKEHPESLVLILGGRGRGERQGGGQGAQPSGDVPQLADGLAGGAVAQNESAVQVQGEDVLAQIARDLVAIMQRDVRTDWTVRDDVRAKLRSSIKRLLVRYKYPPDRQPGAITLVMEQMEQMAPRYTDRAA